MSAKRYFVCDGCGKRTQLPIERGGPPAQWQRVASRKRGMAPSLYCGACYRERDDAIRRGEDPDALPRPPAPREEPQRLATHKGSICEACGYVERVEGLMIVCASCGIEQSGPRLQRLEEELRRAAYKLLRERVEPARMFEILAGAAEAAARHNKGGA